MRFVTYLYVLLAIVLFMHVFECGSMMEGYNAGDSIEWKVKRWKKTGNKGNWSAQVSVKTGPAGTCAGWKHPKAKWVKTKTPITSPRPTGAELTAAVQKAFKKIPLDLTHMILQGNHFTCSMQKTKNDAGNASIGGGTDTAATPAAPAPTANVPSPGGVHAGGSRKPNRFEYDESRCNAHATLDGTNTYIKEHGGDPDKQVWKCQYKPRKLFGASSRSPGGWECEDGGPDADFTKGWVDTACDTGHGPYANYQCMKCEMVDKPNTSTGGGHSFVSGSGSGDNSSSASATPAAPAPVSSADLGPMAAAYLWQG